MNQPPASRYIRLYETHAHASIGVISLYFNCMNVNFSFFAFVDLLLESTERMDGLLVQARNFNQHSVLHTRRA